MVIKCSHGICCLSGPGEQGVSARPRSILAETYGFNAFTILKGHLTLRNINEADCKTIRHR